MSKDLSKIVFFSILALALYLRLHGITNGFPFIFHPDESTIVRSALGVRFYPNPGHFDWPHLYIYLNYFVFMAFAKLRELLVDAGLKDTISAMLPLVWNDELIYYLITRVLTAVSGALTIIPVYLTGKKLFGSKAGLLGALAFALIPFHIRHSHYSLPDAPMVFFLAWAMYFASNILIKSDPAHYAASGSYIGFAASTKYHGGIGAFMVPLAHIFRVIKNKEAFLDGPNIINILLSGIMAFIAFIIGTPYAVLDYKTFLRTDGYKGALWQFTNVGSVPFIERPSRFVTEMTSRIPDDLAYTYIIVLLIVLIILAVKLIKRRTMTVDYHAWFIMLTALGLLFYVSGFARPRSHYYMIAYPFIAVLFGYFGALIFEKLESKLKIGIFFIYALLFLPPLYFSTLTTYTFGNADTRNLLDSWIEQNASNSRIIYNSSSLVPLMQKYKDISEKGADKLDSTSVGFYVYSPGSETTEDGDSSFGTLKYSNKLEKILVIDNEHRNGPEITIYRIIQ